MTTYVGWHRPLGGKWEAVVEHADFTECWRQLIQYKVKLIPKCEKCVLLKGRHP